MYCELTLQQREMRARDADLEILALEMELEVPAGQEREDDIVLTRPCNQVKRFRKEFYTRLHELFDSLGIPRGIVQVDS